MIFRTTILRENSIVSDRVIRSASFFRRNGIFRVLGNYDLILFSAVLALVFLGLLSLFSTTQPSLASFYKQILWLAIGLAVFWAVSSFDYRFFRVHSLPALLFYILGTVGVVGVVLFGVTIRGAKSWIDVGFFNIEPVELVKVALVLILAKYFSTRHVEIYRLRHIIITALYVLIPAVLVLMQPDVGSFVILCAIWGGMMLVAGIKFRHIMTLAFLGSAVSIFAWKYIFVTYQKERIFAFLNPESDPLGAAYNSIQSTVAAFSGGFWGKGFAQGTQAQLGFLPEAQTDFIFSAISEEFGLFTALLILILFCVIFWRMARIALATTNNFARLTVVGIAIIIMVQVALNVGMSIAILPVTGITLPFVSYGGSSLITLFLALGIVQSIYRFSTSTTPKHYDL